MHTYIRHDGEITRIHNLSSRWMVSFTLKTLLLRQSPQYSTDTLCELYWKSEESSPQCLYRESSTYRHIISLFHY
jgi:hypothetical protein